MVSFHTERGLENKREDEWNLEGKQSMKVVVFAVGYVTLFIYDG